MNRGAFKLMTGALGALLSAVLMSCGGGGGGAGVSGSGNSTPANNVASITVDSGPNNNSANAAFVTVTVCAAGSTSNCQTIDHVLVDTGSYGLRVLASALNSLTLQPIAAPGGGALAECVGFVDGYTWGPVVSADVTVGGETASALPTHVIGDSRYPNVPSDCSAIGGPEEDTVSAFGANGVLGIGPLQYDCGSVCVSGTPPGASYYSCSSSSCAASNAPLASQVQSFVAKLATDNNGVIVQFPTVGGSGAASLTGTLTFGIDTASNNASGSETVVALDSQAYLLVTFNGAALNQSFIDSGTNGLYFTDASIPACTQTNITGFYCPTSTLSLTAVISSNVNTGVSATYDFSLGNANDMFQANPTFAVFPELGGVYPDNTTATFDIGLPFFYGRRVAVALEGATTSVGTGPYMAF